MVDKRDNSDKEVSRRRQLISGANAAVVIAATIGIAILANAIVSNVTRLRVDLTENNLYTLSEASKEVVGELEEPVTVKAYISADLPPPMHTLRRRVKDLLTEYKAASGGKLNVQVYAPGGERLTDEQSKNVEKEAKGYGCEKVGMGQRGKDKFSLRAVLKCVAFIQEGGEKTEVIKELKTSGSASRDNFEYEFTKALMNLVDREPRKVGFVAGFGGPADQRGFSQQIEPTFEQLFGSLITPTTVDLSTETKVPEGISSLVILNPTKKFSDKAKWAIDQFLQQGGSVGWFQSSTGIDRQMRRKMMQKMGRRRNLPSFRKPLDPGLRDFFGAYGAELRQDLVLDRDNAMVGLVRTDRGLASVSFPATFTTTNIDKSLPFTKDFGTLAFPAPSSIELTAGAKGEESLEVYEVVKTAESATRRPGVQTDLGYEALNEPTDEEEPGPFVLAAALQGDLPSYFADRQPPQGVEAETSEASRSASSRLLVIGSGNFFQPQQKIAYNQRLASLGGQFFISSIEWLVQDSALAQIRGKSMPRLIDKVERTKKRTIQFVNIAGVPALFALIGLGMWARRRRRRGEFRRDEK
mgnify:CR=1 FL=1